MLSQKCQYALRAAFELAKHYGDSPVRIAEIAEAQAIPQRFLEAILAQLKQGGLVESRRGREGGYMLARTPEAISVGEIIRFIEGPIAPVGCVAGDAEVRCPLHGDCVFMGMWQRASDALAAVYDGTTLDDLMAEEQTKRGQRALCYSI